MRLNKMSHYNLFFSLHKAFAISRAQQLFMFPPESRFNLVDPYSLLSWLHQELILCSKINLELLGLIIFFMASRHVDERDNSIYDIHTTSKHMLRQFQCLNHRSEHTVPLLFKPQFSTYFTPQIIPSIVKMEYLQAFLWV